LSKAVFVRAARCVGAVATAAIFLFVAAPAFAKSSSAADTSGGAGLGIVTKVTSKNVPKVTGDSKHLGDRTLKVGMSGHDVRVLQAYLTVAGFGAVVDGDFGPATLTSVIGFERAHGFTPNGIVTLAVADALRNAVAAVEATPPTGNTRINPDGTATAPAGAPAAVVQVVAAANSILDTSYCVGGGHGSWKSSCYDCSGSVSFALHGGGLLSSSEDSTGLESWGESGPGRWITVYADASHAFMVVAGRAFDTADYGGPNIPAGTGPRWRTNPLGNLADGGSYVVRHPAGL
jgi:cell wall-associated NlpC family hydrolase